MQQATNNTSVNFLKAAMYVSEALLINVLFLVFFRKSLSPGHFSFSNFSPLYGWLSMTITLCYAVGVSLRPISFYLRSSRRGSIVSNVIKATVYEFALFIIFALLQGFVMSFATSFSFFAVALRLCIFATAQIVVLILWRYLALFLIRLLRRTGHNVHHIVLVGQGDNLLELYQEMSSPFYGYKVMGYFNDTPSSKTLAEICYLGRVSDVVPYLEQHQIHQLYCALPSVMASDIKVLIDYCEKNCIRFFSVPNVRNYLKRQMRMELVGSVPVLMIREDPLESFNKRFAKRTFDLIFSSVALIFFWILIFPVVALLTKVLQPGPVFFKQKRNGINGKEFLCYKFRSMKVNNDSDKKQATKGDDRITKFGHFLRKSSIDELPQLINVFKGEMSIVGPRPHMVKHTEEYSALIDKYMVRHWVRPGITGWAQVTGARGETSELWQMEDRINKDIWYIENWSMMLDIRIIFMTAWNAIRGDKQAY